MKIQEFSQGFKALSKYYPKENVWVSDFCQPYEWNSEEEMRRDMLIHFLADNEHEKMMFSLWDCFSEESFMARYEQYQDQLRQESLNEYDPNN